MIGLLRGRPSGDELDGPLVIDVGGVGYEVITPLGTLGRLTADGDGSVVLHVHTNVREDAIELFGFASAVERQAFRTLIAISKVGPRLALNVLSAVTVDELVRLVETRQVGVLTRVPGVGKKTAERLVLELEGKLGSLPRGARTTAPRAPARPSGQGVVLHDALVRMGFKSSEAERAVAQLDDLDRPLGELIRDALGVLSP
jgi:holliday junction DNA helicase RuvA